MKKILFIDRDGTIIQEPPVDYQVDSMEKLAFVPGVIGALREIVRETDYRLVMVSNQDGLGTERFPMDAFLPPHEFMLKTLAGEGIVFDEILIDGSMGWFSPEETGERYGRKVFEWMVGWGELLRDWRSVDGYAVGG